MKTTDKIKETCTDLIEIWKALSTRGKIATVIGLITLAVAAASVTHANIAKDGCALISLPLLMIYGFGGLIIGAMIGTIVAVFAGILLYAPTLLYEEVTNYIAKKRQEKRYQEELGLPPSKRDWARIRSGIIIGTLIAGVVTGLSAATGYIVYLVVC
jgi:hypothetical protein